MDRKGKNICLADFRIILLGDANVGKTSLFKKIVYPKESKIPNIQTTPYFPDIFKVDTSLGEQTVEMFDTAGQEAFHSLVSVYFRGVDAAVLVYDISRKSSFSNLSSWLYKLREKAPANCMFYIVGNKKDLVEHDYQSRKVATTEGRQFATSNGAHFQEVSANEDSRDALLKIVTTLADQLMQRDQKDPNRGRGGGRKGNYMLQKMGEGTTDRKTHRGQKKEGTNLKDHYNKAKKAQEEEDGEDQDCC